MRYEYDKKIMHIERKHTLQEFSEAQTRSMYGQLMVKR